MALRQRYSMSIRLACTALALIGAQAAIARPAKTARSNPVPNCAASLSNPSLFRSRTIKYHGTCPTGFAEGHLRIVARSSDPTDVLTYDIDSTFVRGVPTGRTTVSASNGVTFAGLVDQGGGSIGTAMFPNGDVVTGARHPDRIWRATLTSKTFPIGTRYYLRGFEVPQSFYVADTSSNPLPAALFEHASIASCPTPSVSKAIPEKQRTYCNGKPASGVAAVQFLIGAQPATLIAEFRDGSAIGPARIDLGSDAYFFGTVKGFARVEGITFRVGVGAERGIFRAEKLYDGIFTPADAGQTGIAVSYERGKVAGPSESAQRALLARLSGGGFLPHMTKVRLGSGTCFANLPAEDYKIRADMPGRCVDGYYSGPASLSLSPLKGGLIAQRISVAFEGGLPIGDARVTRPNGETFQGTLVGWLPATGQITRALGGGDYEIASLSAGVVISRRREHREPSQAELAGRQILGALLGGLTRCAQGGCGGSDRRAQGTYASSDPSQQTLSTAASSDTVPEGNSRPSQDTSCGVYTRDGQYVLSTDPVQCQSAARGPRGGPYSYSREGAAPAPSTPDLSMGRPDDQPNTGGLSRSGSYTPYSAQRSAEYVPPTNQRGGDYVAPSMQRGSDYTPPSAQRDSSYQPPSIARGEDYVTPTMQRGGDYQPPSMQRGGDYVAPSMQRGSDYKPPSAQRDSSYQPPSTARGEDYVTPTMQRGGDYVPPSGQRDVPPPSADRSGTTPVLTRDASYRMDSGQPGAPRQPASDSVGSAGSTTPATSQGQSTPPIPTGLYPTNSGELALPITLGWAPASGSKRYRLTVHDLTDGTFPVDDQFVDSNSFPISSLKPGHQFAWDVAACNAAGCSGRSANRSFRTAPSGSQFVWDCGRIVGQGALGRSYTAEERAFIDKCKTPSAEGQCALNSHLPYNSGMLPRETIAGWLTSNAKEAARRGPDVLWFTAMVVPGGPWDYKKYGYRSYESFGNYHYGYTGAAAGFSRDLLLRAAGAVQIAVDTHRGKTTGAGSPLGPAPFGDQYLDQYQIINGINDYNLCHGK